jgi:hypothetical protein
MVDNDSFNQGLQGTGPPGHTNWDDYQRGKSIRDWNQQALSPRGGGDSMLLGGGEQSYGPSAPVGPSPLADFVANVATGSDEEYERLPVLPGIPGIAAALLVSPVVLLLLPLWGILYPLSGAATLIGALTVAKLVGAASPSLKMGDLQVFMVVSGAILVFVCTRVEQIASRVRP